MEIEKEFNNSNLIRKRIIYPAYQTTRRFHNLYNDVRTWVRELIQNADDADAETIQFNVNIPNLVEVINNGHPFDSNDIERLLTPCLGGKELDKTGAMNLGALSVLAISDSFFYHSGNVLLKFEMDHEKEDFVPYIDENSPSYFKGTKLILPFHSRLSRDDLKKLDKIDEYLTQYSHLLFTRKLKSIVLNYPTKKLELIKEVEKESKFKFGRVQASVRNIIIIEKFTKGKKEHLISSKWLLFKRNVVIPKKFLNKKDLEQFPEGVELPLYFAFAIKDYLPKRVDFPIYIIFPSDTSLGLGFVLCSNFKPETSRKGFSTEGINGRLNIFLLRKASELIELMLIYFKKKLSSFSVPNKKRFFNALLETLYYRETYSSLESYIKDHIYNKVIRFLEKNILDKDGNWIQASKIAIADSALWSFLNNQYYFIEKPLNDKVTKLLKVAGVMEITIKDLVDKLSFGEIRRVNDLLNIWTYLSINRNKLNKKMKEQLINNKTLPNRIGTLTNPKLLAIPDEDAIGLYDSRKELNAEFVKNGNLNNFILGLGIKRIKRNQVLEYFISIKSRLSLKNIHLIKKYYKFFYKFGLFDKKREIVLTNQGFKNPNDAFFNQVSIANFLGNKIPLIPRKLESSRICRMYLENLGVSKEIKAKFVVKHIKKYGNKVISLDLLKFLSKNSKELNSRDLKGLEKMEIIPTTDGKFVRPSECYLLTDQNEKILANLVNYFDPKDETNKEWIKFFKKIGIPKHPRIKHLQLALKEALATYQTLEKSNDDNKNKVLERIELILNSILKNGQKEEKEILLLELEKLNFIPTTKGINRPCDIYLREPKIVSFLGESVPYSLIKIPNELVIRLGIHKKPIPEDLANYLLYWLIKQKPCNVLKSSNDDPVKLFDRIYSFLGREENFNKLRIGIIKKLLNKSIIYLPRYKCFEKASRLVTYSREAEMIYGNEKNLIKYSDYPNSLNFFKRVGVRTSINSNDIADFLVEYINQGEIETQRIFMLYKILGQRFRFLSNKKQLMVKKSKIILCEDLKSFDYPDNVFIPDEKSYIEKFPSIKVAIVNDKVIEFLECVGVRKISNVIIKKVVFSSNVIEDDYSKSISQNIKELIPFLEIIAKESSIPLDKDWKKRLNQIKCGICTQIFYELQYKTKKNKIQGRSVEYDLKNKMIGITKGINTSNPVKFLLDLSKAISSILFINDVSRAKIMSPLIEKLLQSESKIQTLKELGFSTFKLEAKKYNIPKVKFKIPKIMETSDDLSNGINKFDNSSICKKTQKIHKYQPLESTSWTSKKFKVIKKNYLSENQLRKVASKENPTIKGKEQINIILKMPPPQNQIVKYIKNKFNETVDNGKISNYYNISVPIKKILNKFDKKLFKTIKFPGRAEYGGLDITPPIPKLNLEKFNSLYFYKQEGKEIFFQVFLLKKFQTMLQFIVKTMEGNPETVSVAVFNASVNAFNLKGQLIFNYLLMMEESSDIPLFMIWIFVVAHELAHNLSPNHDQVHSKYMTIFAIRGIQKLETIRKKYIKLFTKN